MSTRFIGLTAGDLAGIGPEIVAKTITHFKQHPEELQGCILKIIGESHPHHPGHPDKESSYAALASLEEAAAKALKGELAAVVTGPVSKHQLHQVGFPFPGQTEFFAARAGVTNFAMLLTGGRLTVALVTAHLPLHQVTTTLKSDEIVRVGKLLIAFLQKRHRAQFLSKLAFDNEVQGATARRPSVYRDILEDAIPASAGMTSGATLPFESEIEVKKKSPRIAVLGLNPHAGEQGDLGEEEGKIIAPAIARLHEEHPGTLITGPVSPDTAFWHAIQGAYDGLLCMYHDQGLIPLKLHAFEEGVNVTLGLPFLRMSPDHGTAYDLAGKGIASAQSMISAVRLAALVIVNN